MALQGVHACSIYPVFCDSVAVRLTKIMVHFTSAMLFACCCILTLFNFILIFYLFSFYTLSSDVNDCNLFLIFFIFIIIIIFFIVNTPESFVRYAVSK